MLQLLTFAISHFSEKARWTLDLSGFDYAERHLLPGPHMLVTRRLARGTSVPILQHDGRAIQGSGAILDYVQHELGAKRLAPEPACAAECTRLEALADKAFGLGVQQILYAMLLDEPKLVIDLWTQRGPRYGRGFYALTYPAIASVVRRMYRIDPVTVEHARDRFRRAMDETDRALSGKHYLLGDRLSRADITVASLLAPVCRPPQHLLRWPELPESTLAFAREFEDRPTYQHVLRLYREERA
jgi:glutathione S-transferase